MTGQDDGRGSDGADPRAASVDLPMALAMVGAATVTAMALTEHFEALYGALASYASAHFLLRGD
jgi:hypothetical protein